MTAAGGASYNEAILFRPRAHAHIKVNNTKVIICDNSCLFCPQIGHYHTVGHLILEEIPAHDTDDSSTHDVRDVTAVEIEMKAVSKVKHNCDAFVKPKLVNTAPVNDFF